MEEIQTNIEVRLEIPAVKFRAAAQEIMAQYGEVVKEAMDEIKKDLYFDKAFQESVKQAVKIRLDDVVHNAIKSAAEQVVWQTFMDRNATRDIQKVISDSIMSALQEKE